MLKSSAAYIYRICKRNSCMRNALAYPINALSLNLAKCHPKKRIIVVHAFLNVSILRKYFARIGFFMHKLKKYLLLMGASYKDNALDAVKMFNV